MKLATYLHNMGGCEENRLRNSDRDREWKVKNQYQLGKMLQLLPGGISMGVL